MFKSAVTKIAHNSTIPSLGGNKDLRPLQDLITAEKAVLISLQKLSIDFAKASEALRAWGVGEGDDLGDTLSASTTLLTHFSSALSKYASHGHPMRDHLKAIRTREENLDDLKRRRKAVGSKAEGAERKLSKMSPEHKNLTIQTDALNSLRAEIRSMDSEIMSEEAAIGDFKRAMTRAWMGLKFGGLIECSEKGTIVGEFGKQVIAEIPEETTQPGMARSMYYGHPRTESLVSEAHRCVNEVVLSTALPLGPPDARLNQQHQLHQPVYQDGSGPPPPGAGGWPPHNSGNMNLAALSVPPNYFPPPQGFGAGASHLPDQSVPSPMGMSVPGSPIHQQHSPQQSMSYYPPGEAHQPAPRRSLDDFGISQPSSPIDNAGTGGAGRFATFPVKTRAPGNGTTYTLHDNPPSLSTRHEMGDSFSSSVAEALGTSQQPPRGSIDRPAPIYGASHTPLYSPPPGPPPGAQLPQGHWDPNAPGQQHDTSNLNTSGDDALLAYMMNSDDQPNDTDTVHNHHPESHDNSRHVRFGEANDIDEGNDRHEGAQQPLTGEMSPPPDYDQPQAQSMAPTDSDTYPHAPSHTRGNLGPAGPSGAGPSLQEHRLSGGVSPVVGPRFQNQNRVPPPAEDPEDEERALNAAAAREVSRELDALNHNPPAPLEKDNAPPRLEISTEPTQLPQGQLRPDVGGSSYQNDLSPLAPPSAPFTRRTPSPRPVDSTAPILPSSSPYGSPAQRYTQPPYTQEEQSTEQQQIPPQPQPGGQSSPTVSTIPRLNTSTPLSIADDIPSRFSPMSTQSPYQTPPEFPRGRSASASPMAKSTSSLNAQIPAGTRTISAAAFRRPPPRMGSGDIPMSDTSPLSFKKRLPTSPYPQKREASPMSRNASTPPPPQAPPPTNSLPPIPVDDGDDDYDYLSAYVDSGSLPAERDVGALGPLKIANDSGNRSPGYGEGRFATDLEGNLR